MIRSLALAVALLLGAAAAPGRAAAAPPPEARVQKEQGDQLKKAGDLPGAEQAYRQALQADAGYAEAHEALGSVLYAEKRFDEAIRSFVAAVEIDPALANGWYSLAFAQRRVANLPKARVAYEKYNALRPADPDGHYGLAETLRGLKERDAAMVEYQRFIELARANPAQAPWVEKARTALADLQAEGPNAPAAVTPPFVYVPPAAAPAVPVAAVAAPQPTVQAPAPPQPAVPSRALVEKLGAGDRAYLAGDYRAALFAYQDAVYLDPSSPTARIKLARAYVALRYPAQAEAQLKQVLDLDPGNEEARKGLEGLKNPPPPPAATAPAAVPVATAPPLRPAPVSAPRVYKLTEDAAGIGTAAMVVTRPQPPPPAEPAVTPAPAAPASPDTQAAAQHYRAALPLIAGRDYKGAVIELDQAIEANPGLGVAYSARASAWYGMARYADAARDYETAIGLAPNLATPLYGVAECYRRLNDPRAAEYYQRYADSSASDVREELRTVARKRVAELGGR